MTREFTMVAWIAFVLLLTAAGCSRTLDDPRLTAKFLPDFDVPARGSGLEFRILANSVDDHAAITEMAQWVNSAETDPARKAELEVLQSKGLPPLVPQDEMAKPNPKQYAIQLPNNQLAKTTYSWIELGPLARQELHAIDRENQQKGLSVLAQSSGKAIVWNNVRENAPFSGVLLYSRECRNSELGAEDRRRKAYDYFVVVRNSENGGKEEAGKRVTGKLLKSATYGVDSQGQPAAHFSFSDKGAELLSELTRKNLPVVSQGKVIKRQIAICAHDYLVVAPTIDGEVNTSVVISGNLLASEIEYILGQVRSGAAVDWTARRK
jgi:hypothetical protein